MDLKAVILKEHSKPQRQKITRYIGDDPKKFAELVDVFLAGPYRVTQRAAWPLSYCIEQNHSLVILHFDAILKSAEKPEAPVAVKRNIVRLLQFIEIPKKFQSRVINLCFAFFINKKEPVAVRVFSMRVLGNFAQKMPELRNELIPLIEDELPYATAGFISRGRKVLKELKG